MLSNHFSRQFINGVAVIGLAAGVGTAHGDELGVVTPSAAPLILTPYQMDAITAGAIGVQVGSSALAIGTHTAYTSTDMETVALKRPGGVVEQAVGKTTAVANGDLLRDADTWTFGYGDGDIVIVVQTGHRVETPKFLRDTSRVFVNSVTPPANGRR